MQNNVIDFQMMLFLLMAVGYILEKRKIIQAKGRRCLTDIVIMVALPCNILGSFFVELDFSTLVSSAVILAISLLLQVFSYLLGLVLFRREGRPRRMVLRYGLICPNSSLIGNPLIEGLYGAGALIYASIFLIPQRIMMWTAGIACFTTVDRKSTVKAILTHPCIIATAAGLLIMLIQIPIPGMINLTVQKLSNCTTGLSMLIVGSIMAEIDIRSVLNQSTLFFSFIRLLLIPAIVLAGCMLFSVDPLVTGITVVLAGTPAGATTAILASKYDGDAGFAAQAVFLSTALSLVTVPLLHAVAANVL